MSIDVRSGLFYFIEIFHYEFVIASIVLSLDLFIGRSIYRYIYQFIYYFGILWINRIIGDYSIYNEGVF